MSEQSTTAKMKSVSGIALFAAALIFLCGSPAEGQQPPAPAATQAQNSAQAVPPAAAAEMPQALHLLVGRSLVITSPTRIKRISLADPEIAEAIVISPYQVVLNGKKPGGVSFLLWDETDQSEAFEVSVDIDILGLNQKIHEAFPSEPVELEASRDVVMVSGKISSAGTAAKILEIVKNAAPKVTSLMEVPLPPTGDILLEVKFAEVQRTALLQLGVNLLYPGTKMTAAAGTQQFSAPSLASTVSTTGNGTTTTTTTGGTNALTNTFNVSNLLNIFLYRQDINLGAIIQALQEKNVLEILAEPNLLTASGKEASFLAGGQFPFPVLQGVSTGGTASGGGITIMFKEFGVRLTFTPTLEADGYIHLKVNPEVSALDYANALTLQGFVIPALSTERFESEMDLKDGQTFAIAGLLDNRVTEVLEKVPGLGDIPLLGKLFQSRSRSKSRNELLVLVTPHIVQPLTPGHLPPGPAFPVPFLANPAAPAPPRTPEKN